MLGAMECSEESVPDRGPKLFWGAILDSYKSHTETLKKPLHVSMAILDVPDPADRYDTEQFNRPIKVMLKYKRNTYLICILHGKSTLQVPLDLNIESGEKVTFTADASVHLTGHFVSDSPKIVRLEENRSINIQPRNFMSHLQQLVQSSSHD